MEQEYISLFAGLSSKRPSQRNRILDLLKKRDFVPTAELRLFSYQYNARIKELRDRGWTILKHKKDGKHGFILI